LSTKWGAGSWFFQNMELAGCIKFGQAIAQPQAGQFHHPGFHLIPQEIYGLSGVVVWKFASWDTKLPIKRELFTR